MRSVEGMERGMQEVGVGECGMGVKVKHEDIRGVQDRGKRHGGNGGELQVTGWWQQH